MTYFGQLAPAALSKFRIDDLAYSSRTDVHTALNRESRCVANVEIEFEAYNVDDALALTVDGLPVVESPCVASFNQEVRLLVVLQWSSEVTRIDKHPGGLDVVRILDATSSRSLRRPPRMAASFAGPKPTASSSSATLIARYPSRPKLVVTPQQLSLRVALEI